MIPDWQMNVLNKLQGVKKNELIMMTAGRRSGKSYWTSQAIHRLMDDIAKRPIEDLKLSEGTVYGARYYTVEPVGGSWREIEQWCMAQFGSAGEHIWSDKAPEPAQRWYMNNRKFWFRNEADRLMFIMKWR